MQNGPVSIIESRWWKTGNHSVKGVLEAVAGIHYDNPSAFYYDMFSDKSSLDVILEQRAEDSTTQVIYLATHGSEKDIGPTPKTAISRAELRNSIIKANVNGSIKGLYLGTCLTGNTDFAKFLIEEKETKLDWVAGYKKSVDWVDGTAIDMVFFSKLSALYVRNKKKKKGKLTPRNMAHKAATELTELITGAHSHYGFNIYFHESGKITSMFNT